MMMNDDACCERWQIGADDEVDSKVSRRAAHPHMNNLVYGRRSDPAISTSHLADWLSAATCRQVINRCTRWQRQIDSDSY